MRLNSMVYAKREAGLPGGTFCGNIALPEI
jgi:hypothetical protein